MTHDISDWLISSQNKTIAWLLPSMLFHLPVSQQHGQIM